MGGRSSSFGKHAGGGTTMAALQGSEKQVKWANEIREDMKAQLAKDGKIVDEYLKTLDDPNADPDKLARLQRMADNTLYSDTGSGMKVTSIGGDDLKDEQSFNDARSQATDFYSGYRYASKESAERDFARIKSDYLKSGGRKVWDLAKKYYEAPNSKADKAFSKWQKEAEKARFKYIRSRWNDRLANEKSASWYIDNRINNKHY